MRGGVIVISVLVGLLGLVWVGQGVGLIRGSFMTGDPKWAVIGAVLIVAAAAGVVWSLRRRSRQAR